MIASGATPNCVGQVRASQTGCVSGRADLQINRQLQSQAKTFEQKGGFSERLYRVRSEARVRDGGK